MTEFRDAIADALAADAGEVDKHGRLLAGTYRHPDANAVLAMPEMKAIKAYIREDVDGAETAAEAREWLNSLPESVIDWVMGDDDE